MKASFSQDIRDRAKSQGKSLVMLVIETPTSKFNAETPMDRERVYQLMEFWCFMQSGMSPVEAFRSAYGEEPSE